MSTCTTLSLSPYEDIATSFVAKTEEELKCDFCHESLIKNGARGWLCCEIQGKNHRGHTCCSVCFKSRRNTMDPDTGHCIACIRSNRTRNGIVGNACNPPRELHMLDIAASNIKNVHDTVSEIKAQEEEVNRERGPALRHQYAEEMRRNRQEASSEDRQLQMKAMEESEKRSMRERDQKELPVSKPPPSSPPQATPKPRRGKRTPTSREVQKQERKRELNRIGRERRQKERASREQLLVKLYDNLEHALGIAKGLIGDLGGEDGLKRWESHAKHLMIQDREEVNLVSELRQSKLGKRKADAQDVSSPKASKIAFSEGDAVFMRLKNQGVYEWYQGKILETRGSKYKVSFPDGEVQDNVIAKDLSHSVSCGFVWKAGTWTSLGEEEEDEGGEEEEDKHSDYGEEAGGAGGGEEKAGGAGGGEEEAGGEEGGEGEGEVYDAEDEEQTAETQQNYAETEDQGNSVPYFDCHASQYAGEEIYLNMFTGV